MTDGQTYEQTRTVMYQLYRKILGEIVDGVLAVLTSGSDQGILETWPPQ